MAKRLTFDRTFIHVAREHKLIDENPFAEVKIPAADVSARRQFVGRDAFDRMIDHAAPVWQTIIALSRLGGLRCPSEVLSLERRHVDWQGGRVTVPSPKTDGYDGKASRLIPLFPELRTFLEAAFELAEPGEAYVVGGLTGQTFRTASTRTPGKWMNANLRTTMNKIVKRAGLEPWPRLFHNLRSSRETEPLEEFPVHVVAAWMGHDAKVSLKHNAQLTEDHFDRATGGALAAQNAAQQTPAEFGRLSQPMPQMQQGEAVTASPCEPVRDSSKAYSGAGGI